MFGSVLVAGGDVTMSDVAVVTVAELSKNVRQTVVIKLFFPTVVLLLW